MRITNVGELRAAIKDLPDSLPVYVFDDGLALVHPTVTEERAYPDGAETRWQAPSAARPKGFPCIMINQE